MIQEYSTHPCDIGPVVFLDRDGVINIDSPGYITSPDAFRFIKRAGRAVALLCNNGFSVIVVTNQSAVGRGLMTEETLNAIHEKMLRGIKDSGGEILDVFFCPHRPDEGCFCRKPSPGMILDAVRKYSIDRRSAGMVGDKPSDILCASNAGLGYSIAVKTGTNPGLWDRPMHAPKAPDFVAKDLYDAARWIIKTRKRILLTCRERRSF